MIGELVGHYRVVAKIGEGGMGVVYRARDDVLNRDVALKVVADTAVMERAGRGRAGIFHAVSGGTGRGSSSR